VRAVYRSLAIENVKSNIMNHILLQVLGLVAFIKAHKDLKARNLAESATLPTSPVPVRRSRTFKECFTTVALVYIASSLIGAAINVAVEARETRHVYNDCMRQLLKPGTRDMYKLRM